MLGAKSVFQLSSRAIEAIFTGRDCPCCKHSAENVLCSLIRYKVKMEWVFAVEKNALDKGDHITAGVVACTHNGNMNNLHRKQ